MSHTTKKSKDEEIFTATVTLVDLLSLSWQEKLCEYLMKKTRFTPEYAEKMALSRWNTGDDFTVPEIFGEDWRMYISEGTEHSATTARVFGQKFIARVRKSKEKQIKIMDYMRDNRQVYRIIGRGKV